MAFIGGKNVGCFGLINNEDINLCSYPSNNNSADSVSIEVLTVNDTFDIQVDQTSESLTKENSNLDNLFTSASISDCGKFVTATDMRKNVFLWTKKKNWIPTSRRSLLRKPYKTIFTHCSSEIIVADRGGDVFSFSVDKPSEKETLILGHISIILDLVMSENDRFIITCDRDGKIRISNYPNCYNIHTYCLGHKEFVYALHLIHNSSELLLSSSGDSTMKLWQYQDGKETFSYSLDDIASDSEPTNTEVQVSSTKVVKQIRYCSDLNLIITFFYNISSIDIFHISNNIMKHIQCITFENIPIDGFFGSENLLLILLSSVPSKIITLKCDSSKHIKFIEVDNQEYSLCAVISKLNQKLLLSKLSSECQIDILALYKQCFGFDQNDDCIDGKVKKNKLSK